MDIRAIGTADELEVADKVINEQFEIENKSREYPQANFILCGYNAAVASIEVIEI